MDVIYESIYKVVDGNLKKATVENEYKLSTLMADVGQKPQDIDLQKILHLQGDAFIEAAYMVIMKRLPDHKEMNYWMLEQDQELLKRNVIQAISNSGTVMINHIRLHNHPYIIKVSRLKRKLFELLYGLTDKSYLREFGKKMPMFMQKIIRKLFF